jgi:PAS domain S-box-containing protein
MKHDAKTKKQLVHKQTGLHSQNAKPGKSMTGCISAELVAEEACRYAESIVETIREPLLVLDADLKIISANRNFYRTFKVAIDETIGCFIFDLGNQQWDIPKLRELLEQVLLEKETFDDFEVSHNFQNIGHKVMLLNARRIHRKDIGAKMILLAIEDITERSLAEHKAGERMKELRAFYNLSNIASRKGITLHELYEEFVKVLPESWQYPEITCARIVIEDSEFRTENFAESAWMQSAPIKVNLKVVGRIDVCYLAERSEEDEGPFLKEERMLIDSLCERLGRITERRQMGILLAESEERYRRLFETASDGILLLEKCDGKIVHANQAVERILGYTDQEIIGNRLQDLGVRLDMGDFQTIMQNLNKTGILNYDNVPVKNKSGQYVYTDIYLVDRARLVQCNIRDITERTRTEKALKKSRSLLEETERIGNVGGWEFDMDTGKQTWTKEIYRIHEVDFTFDPTVRKGVNFYAPASRPIIEKAVQRILEHGEPFDLELEIITAKGNLRTVHVIGRADLEHRRVYGFFQDITDRKQKELELLNSETRFREMFDNAPIGYHELDNEGRVIRVNRTELSMLGYSAEEMLGRHVWEFVDEKDVGREAVLNKLAGVFPPGENIERNYRKKDGTRIPLLIQDMFIRGNDGNISGIRTTVQDMTYRKLVDRQLQDTLESLRKAVGVTIQVMVSAVETRDPYTAGHQSRSASLARAIATEMGLSHERIEGIRMASSIHDIGKLSIPAEILSKPTKLSAIEFSLIREHARQGYEILKNVESPWPLAEMVYQHHERMDGSGYPRNLKGEEICIEARILSVADVVEAMASHRPYRPGLGIDAALDEIEKNSGSFYDAAVAEACLRLFREKGYRLAGA